MLRRTERILENIPVGSLGLISLTGCEELGKKVDDYLVKWRHESGNAFRDDIAFSGYEKDSYLLDARVPRFGSGEAKGVLGESVRGKDLYLMVDVCNYSITYSLAGKTNHMSPDDHFQNLKRIIAAIGGKDDVSMLSCRFYMRAVSTKEVPVNHSTALLLCRNLYAWELKTSLLLTLMTHVYKMRSR